MKKILYKISALALITAMLGACSTYSSGLAPSTTPVDGRKYSVIGEASGSGWMISILGISGSETNPTAAARDRAIADANADGLIDVQIDTKIYQFFLASFFRTNVSGKAFKFN